MELRQATINDLDLIYYLENTCFLEAEAAGYASLKSRLETFSEGYSILYVENKAVGYIGGLKTNKYDLPDEMYHDSSLHDENGSVQAIFSVCILPEYRRQGYASYMVKEYVKSRDVLGFVLTCKDYLIGFYSSCGFVFDKVSASSHGGAKWNDMYLKKC